MSYDLINEDVPAFDKRVGDYVVQGSNNAMLVLGTDRAAQGPAGLADGLGHINAQGSGKGTGTAHLIAGRLNKDPDLDKDLSYLYLSMKTEVDKNLGTGEIEGNVGKVPAAIVKSDAVRVVARKDVKIVFENTQNYIYLTENRCVVKIGGNVFMNMTNDKLRVDVGGKSFIEMTEREILVDGPRIRLGEKASQEALIKGKIFTQDFLQHGHPSAVGPTGPVLPNTVPNIISETHLSKKSFLE